MGMLRQTADQIALFVQAFVGVGMFFQAAVIDRGLRQTVVGMDMLGSGTSAGAVFVMDMGGIAAQVQFFIYRQLAVAQNHIVTEIVGDILDTVGGIAFNGLDLGRFICGGGNDFSHQTHMVGKAVTFPVVENQIAGFRLIDFRGMVQFQSGQILNPGADTVI